MAKLYILSQEHIKSGTRPKTPNEKYKRRAYILTLITILEATLITYLLYRH